MSKKRTATTELNHDNWDQEDEADQEEMGTFKAASKDILEKRVIRTAKRRTPLSGEEPQRGVERVFSGFGGFNKTKPPSFDILSNLINNNKNGSQTSKSDVAVTSSLFSSKPLSSSQIFEGQDSSSSNSKSTFGMRNQTTSLFGSPTLGSQNTTSIFTASKADSTVADSPFKSQPISSSTEVSSTDITKTSNITGTQKASSLFGVSSTNTNASKSLFTNTINSSPYKIQPVSSTSTVQSNFGSTTTTTTVSKPSISEKNINQNENEEKKLKYYSKLKGLNESVSDWIKKHVSETPLCILSPIFKDYEKYLKEMQQEYQGGDTEKIDKVPAVKSSEPKPDLSNDKNAKTATIHTANSSPFAKSNSPAKSVSPFSLQGIPSIGQNSTIGQNSPIGQKSPMIHKSPIGEKATIADKPNFSFGIKTSSTSLSTATSPGFTFGISTAQTTTTTTTGLFSMGSNMNSNGTKPFSFGTGKPFSFSSNIQKPATETTDPANEEGDEPPKVEYTPVVEENSVFDKKCKIFVKKDGNFVDKGVGTLYIKKIEESGKHQLLVRANTNLGNILLNLILASAIPTQRMGKNNVMMVCIPTPEAKPPPMPVLIRVKTSEEADELLETLNKYKA